MPSREVVRHHLEAPLTPELREALGHWDFDRLIVGHGELLEAGSRDALRSAYAWLH